MYGNQKTSKFCFPPSNHPTHDNVLCYCCFLLSLNIQGNRKAISAFSLFFLSANKTAEHTQNERMKLTITLNLNNKLLFLKTHLHWYGCEQGLQTRKYVEITKNNQESCVWCQVQSDEEQGQTVGNSGPCSLQSPILQPYYHIGNSSLERWIQSPHSFPRWKKENPKLKITSQDCSGFQQKRIGVVP